MYQHLYTCILSVVDEYIAIAKEKHGYNVEQVDTVCCTVLLVFLFDSFVITFIETALESGCFAMDYIWELH